MQCRMHQSVLDATSATHLAIYHQTKNPACKHQADNKQTKRDKKKPALKPQADNKQTKQVWSTNMTKKLPSLILTLVIFSDPVYMYAALMSDCVSTVLK